MDISGHFPLGRSEGYGSLSGSGRLNYVRGKNRTIDDNLANTAIQILALKYAK